MKRILGSLNKRGLHGDPISNDDSPEASAARGVRLFCESAAAHNSGDEVLHLPVIVEAAESSPVAAKEAANVIRKFLSKENYQRAYVQYNAIMLIRILADNPGKSFTRNLDGKFVVTVKELLRDGRDMSVQQILRETLDTLEAQKPDDETLTPLREMWRKERQKYGANPNNNGVNRDTTGYSQQAVPRTLNAPPYDPNQQNYFARSHRSRGLPPPDELAARIEEARTSGKLLQQVVQSTAAGEILHNDLIKEFAERCQSASRSIQAYIHAENPAPDDQTLLTLIETNEQLSQAMSKHQRALLQARRVTGATSVSPSPPPAPPPVPPPRRDENRNPFHHASHSQQWHPPSLPSPLEPNYYGSMAPPGAAILPPSGQSNARAAGEQPEAYLPVHSSATGSVPPQELSVDHTTIHEEAPSKEQDNRTTPVEARHPVTYRY